MIMLRFWLCLAGLLLGNVSFGIQAVSSYSIFYMPEGNKMKPYIEVYWEITPGSIGYHKTAEGFQGKVETKIVFRNDTGIIAQDHYILETPLSQSIEDAGKQNIIDLHRYMLPG